MSASERRHFLVNAGDDESKPSNTTHHIHEDHEMGTSRNAMPID
jgi:hypothetical protein